MIAAGQGPANGEGRDVSEIKDPVSRALVRLRHCVSSTRCAIARARRAPRRQGARNRFVRDEEPIMASCRSCGMDVLPGTRWCGVCRASLVNPGAGRLAPPAKRLAAFALDLTVPVIAWMFTFSTVVAGIVSGNDAALGGSGLLAFSLWAAYVIWSLILFSRGMTPGKRLIGIRVVREDLCSAGFGTMLVREWIGKWISGLIFSLGYIWILLDRDKQGWHDKLMSTYVIEQRPGTSSYPARLSTIDRANESGHPASVARTSPSAPGH
jgi:uncharacterized RDD family membrane protein YckC